MDPFSVAVFIAWSFGLLLGYDIRDIYYYKYDKKL